MAQLAFNLHKMALYQLTAQCAGRLITRRFDDLPNLSEAEAKSSGPLDEAERSHCIRPVKSIFIGGVPRRRQDSVRFIVADGGAPNSDLPGKLTNGHQTHRPTPFLLVFD